MGPNGLMWRAVAKLMPHSGPGPEGTGTIR
jgi:hypothetical protein